MRRAGNTINTSQSGFTLIELMVSIVIAMTVMAGVVQVLVVSKSNFMTGRELATLQENARYAMKYLTDEIRMAGFTGCSKSPVYRAITVNGAEANSSWFLNYPGIEGFEDAGVGSFPVDFGANVHMNTDAVVVRRSENTGLRVEGHDIAAAEIDVNKVHSYERGQVFVLSKPNCDQLTVFQMSDPANEFGTEDKIFHAQGVVTPGNCTPIVTGGFDCIAPPSTAQAFPIGSNIRELRSEAYYIGTSLTEASVPALYRQRMVVEAGTVTTRAEELVKGVENMQILYGLDLLDAAGALGTGGDALADQYVRANLVTNWGDVVSVRLSLRMRSLLPVYNQNTIFDEFEGVADTDGSDRFMRQDLSTIITLRNR